MIWLTTGKHSIIGLQFDKIKGKEDKFNLFLFYFSQGKFLLWMDILWIIPFLNVKTEVKTPFKL